MVIKTLLCLEVVDAWIYFLKGTSHWIDCRGLNSNFATDDLQAIVDFLCTPHMFFLHFSFSYVSPCTLRITIIHSYYETPLFACLSGGLLWNYYTFRNRNAYLFSPVPCVGHPIGETFTPQSPQQFWSRPSRPLLHVDRRGSAVQASENIWSIILPE